MMLGDPTILRVEVGEGLAQESFSNGPCKWSWAETYKDKQGGENPPPPLEAYMEVGVYGGIWVMANGLSGCIEMHVKEGGQ